MKLHVLKPSVNNMAVRVFVRAAKLGFTEDDVYIELGNARAIERAEQKNRAVGLIGVGDLTRKIADEPARGASGGMRAGRKNRLFRLQRVHHIDGCFELFHA